MKTTTSKINNLSIIFILVIIFGVLSSYYDFGTLSVFFSIIMPMLFIVNCVLAIYGIFRKKYLGLLGILIFFLFYSFFYRFSFKTKLETKGVVSVLTYNVGGFIYAYTDNPNSDASNGIIKFIDSTNADILVFQEASYQEGTKIKGYPYTFIGYRENIDKSLLAIYSKHAIINKGYIDFPDTKNNAIYADVKIKKDTIRIYNSHLQSFLISESILAKKYKDISFLRNLDNTNTKQIEQARLIKDHADKSNKNVIICGDFNSTAYSQTYRVLKQGMNDSYLCKGNGYGKTYTFFHYPLRLDYFLNDDNFEILSHENFTLNLSDHEPIFIKFKIK